MTQLRPASFSYDERRATEVAAFLIARLGGDNGLNYTKLLKLMYLFDRRFLLEMNRPAIGGAYVSMNHGPVMSETYDLIKGADSGVGHWNEHIERSGRYAVRVAKDPGTGRFSRSIRRILESVIEEFGSRSWQDLSHFCHENCREWEHPAGSSRAISYEGIFAAERRSSQIEELKRESREARMVESVFGQ